jgi:tetratricopeptide (TPR) repeat protein
MRFFFVIICLFFTSYSFSQDWREELNLARKLYKTKQYYAAYNRYLKVNQIKPKDIDIRAELAQASYKLGYADKSADYYTKILKSKPKNEVDLNYNLGNSYFKSGDYKNSIEAYKKALRSRPNDEQVRHNLTLALKKQNENKPQNQPEDNQDNKNQPKQQPNPKNNDKKKQENQPSPEQSMQKDRTERMLDELMKQEMKAKQDKNKSNTSNNSNNNGKDW